MASEDPQQKQSVLASWIRQSEGSTAWLLLLRVFVFSVLTGINFIIFSFLYVEYSSHFDSPKATLGVIQSFESGATVAGSLSMSWPVERFGFARMTFIGSMIAVAGLTTASLANSVVMLSLTQGIISGFGNGIAYLCAPVVVQRHFSRNKALANGFATLGYDMGSTIGPPIIKAMIDNFGWRGTLLLVGGLSANRAAIGLSFRPPDNNQARVTKSVTRCTQTLKDVINFSVLKNAAFAVFCIGVHLQSLYMSGFMNFTPSRAVNIGISKDRVTYLTTVIFIASTVTRIGTMFLSNMKYIDYTVHCAIGCMLGVPSILFTILLPNYHGALIGCIFAGVCIGTTTALLAVIVVDLCGLPSLSKSLAVMFLARGSAQLAASPLCGWLVDITGTFNLAFIVMGCATGIASLVLGFVYIMKQEEIHEVMMLI